MKLDDQFEWDLDNEDASPEEFAEVYTQELGLNGEFKWVVFFLVLFIVWADCGSTEPPFRILSVNKSRRTKNRCSWSAILLMGRPCRTKT